MHKQFLAIYFPLFSFEILRQPHPLVLFERRGGQLLVKRASPECISSGVKEGMSLSLAQALCPHATAYEHRPQYEIEVLSVLAKWMTRFSPIVALDEELAQFKHDQLKHDQLKHSSTATISSTYSYGLTLDLTGTTRVHKSIPRLLQSILKPLAQRGITAKIGIASTIGAAWALSRFSKEATSHVEEFSSLIGDLPLAALRIDEEAQRMLKGLGSTTIYDLLSLPRRLIPIRFGETITQRIDQLLGKREEVLAPLIFTPPFSKTVRFELPLTHHEQIAKATLDLLGELLDALRHAHRSSRAFTVVFTPYSGSSLQDASPTNISKEITLYAALSYEEQTQRTTQLQSIITPMVENLHEAHGISSITITATVTQRILPRAQELFKRAQAVSKEQQNTLINSLVGRLGASRVGKVEFIPSYLPERSFRFIPVTDKRYLLSRDLFEERPSYFINPPEKVTAISMLPDSPPTRMRWDDEELAITKGIGPEKISDEWWRTSALTERQYFKVQDQHGRWLWIYRQRETMEWFIQGIWV